MPDLTKWVIHDGKTYCWDKRAGKVVEIKITDIPSDQVSKDILFAMLNTDESDVSLYYSDDDGEKM